VGASLELTYLIWRKWTPKIGPEGSTSGWREAREARMETRKTGTWGAVETTETALLAPS
jgi:hypothetical protein